MKSIKELLEFSIINLDKPRGPTSVQVSHYVSERLNARKTSHMGTLDPAVTGVLPITINRACKLSGALMRKDKTYVGIMRVHEDISDKDLKETMKQFVGRITQMPPVRSSVRREERERTVKTFEFIERDGKDILFSTDVEAGTYIRTLVNDLGKEIGGAHMLELRRTEAGIFSEKYSVSLYDFDKAVEAYKKGDEKLLRKILIPADEVVKQTLQTVEIKNTRLKEILTGKPIHANDVKNKPSGDKGDFVGVFCEGKFIELARLVLEGEVIAVPEFVLN